LRINPKALLAKGNLEGLKIKTGKEEFMNSFQRKRIILLHDF
jgi:hypothetical protein